MNKKVVISSLEAVAILGNSLAYAASSSATISYYDTGKNGSTVNMSEV
ncbi:hypothetical protein ACFO9Q_03855 [Paenibacillus sp. GCM10023252]